MALQTLKDVKEINGEAIYQDNEIADGKWSDVDKKFSICVHHGDNTVSFRIQNGPIKEAGKNGCQVTDMIAVAKHIIERLNKDFPCRENAMTLTKLDEALMWQAKRTADRVARNVEGYNKQ